MTVWDFAALVAIFLFGVPHGGFDAAIARRSGWAMNSSLSWVFFHLAYLALATVVAILWWWFPITSLCLFLLISGYHFGASDIANIGSDWLPWIAHGGLVPIAIPSLNPDAVRPIFSILIGTDRAEIVLTVIQIIFILWLLALLGYCFYAFYKKHYTRPLLGLVAMTALAILLPPLMSFAVYFCLLHSRGHIVRLWHSLDKNNRLAVVQEAGVYTLMAWIFAVVCFFYLSGSISASILQITFIGLAALTWPHMILVDYMDKRRALL